jgi:hypothetical protein
LKSEKANISIDFLAAVAILLLALLFAITTVNNMMTPYSGYTKELYPTADRAASLLLEEEGFWQNYSGGNDWEKYWNENPSSVKKIGFSKQREDDVLSGSKVSSFMIPHGSSLNTWWEFPANDTDKDYIENASRALGVGKYNFYLQIRPTNHSLVEKYAANQRAEEMVGDRGDLVSVVRYVMLNHFFFGEFDGSYIYGLRDNNHVASKPIFGIPEDLYWVINNPTGGVTFLISNWSIKGPQSSIQNIYIDDEIKNNATVHGIKLTGNEFTIWDNDVEFDVGNNPKINMAVENQSDTVKFFIPKTTFDNTIPGWENQPIVYIQLNIRQLDVYSGGITWFNSSFKDKDITYPVETILWVW